MNRRYNFSLIQCQFFWFNSLLTRSLMSGGFRRSRSEPQQREQPGELLVLVLHRGHRAFAASPGSLTAGALHADQRWKGSHRVAGIQLFVTSPWLLITDGCLLWFLDCSNAVRNINCFCFLIKSHQGGRNMNNVGDLTMPSKFVICGLC